MLISLGSKDPSLRVTEGDLVRGGLSSETLEDSHVGVAEDDWSVSNDSRELPGLVGWLVGRIVSEEAELCELKWK